MIAWEERGAGVPMVLVHGITEDRHVWDRVVPLLDSDYRCVLLDLRGHGASPLTEDQSALGMAADIDEVVRAAGIYEPPILVGHSLGGFVVTAYATQAPTRAVVNVDQPLRVGDFARQLQPIADVLRGPEWRDVVQQVFSTLGLEQLNAEDRRYVLDHVERVPHEVVLGAWGLLLESQPEELDALVESLLPTITSPYLALHGSRPADGYGEWLGRFLPDATLEVWDGVGHFISLVEPQRLADRVREFVGP
ncbi:MAG TPA: alpha/beta hydrolase [Acidimicrobiales bacterium]|nr:alpha/beta hydrolase [Acidimicrobiales bacterium]